MFVLDPLVAFWSLPSPVQRHGAPVKWCGRILTSLENLKAIEGKEKEKLEKLWQKEERKKHLEEKRIQAAEKKRSQAAKKQSAKTSTESATSYKGTCTVCPFWSCMLVWFIIIIDVYYF